MKNHSNTQIVERNSHIRLGHSRQVGANIENLVIWLPKREFLFFQKISTSPQVVIENNVVPHYSEPKTTEAIALSLNKNCGGQEKNKKNKNSDLLFRDSGKLSTQPSFRRIKIRKLFKIQTEKQKGKLSSLSPAESPFVKQINPSCRQERSP